MRAGARVSWQIAISAALIGMALTHSSSPGQELREDGIFITVANPITSDVTTRVKEQTERAKARKDRQITKIVYDFNPDGREAATPDFGPCLDLAEYIRNQFNLTTVAYVHHKVARHTVLPVLACREIAMAGTAETRIGEVMPDLNAPRIPLQLQAYTHMAGERKAALVMKMIDPTIAVLEGRKNNAVWYVDAAKRTEAAADGVVGIGATPVLPAGRLALLNGDDAVRFGLAALTNKDSRQQVAEAYGISAAGLREDPLQGRTPVAWRIEIRGEVNEALRETVRRRARSAIAKRANFIVIQLENCGGGNIETAQKIAEFLRSLRDDVDKAPVMTVAFIPAGAPDTATFIALGCTEIVMGKDATLGDFSSFVNQPGRNLAAITSALNELAKEQGISPLITSGMLDADLEIHRVRTAKGRHEQRLITTKELDDDRQQKEPAWIAEQQVKFKGQLLTLTGTRAKELGVAAHTVENSSEPRQVYALYGIDATQVIEARPDWLDAIAEFLRYPAVAIILVIVGTVCLILEFKIPGATAPGVVAAVCFVLFFWSQSQLSGDFVILAILLFLLGLILIGIEIFVLPGFGFVGISGIVLVIVGLVLATIERMPQSNTEWMGFGAKVTQFALGMVVAGIAAMVVARYLPNIPVANRLVLTPSQDNPDAPEEAPALPGIEQAVALLGAVGTAATVLRPAGMARFGEQYVDVVSDGGFIPAGARVEVIEVEGTRIVVKEV